MKKAFLLLTSLTFVVIILLTIYMASTGARRFSDMFQSKSRYAYFAMQKPSPSLSARKVVEIQLLAIRHNNRLEEGIWNAFRFTSMYASNQRKGYKEFIEMIHSDKYKALLNFRHMHAQSTDYYRNKAFQMVTLTDAAGKKTTYLFELSLYSLEPARGCWLVTNIRKISDTHGFYVI